MLRFPPAVRIWLALAPADLRKGFDALAELLRQHPRADPLSGHVFVFRNRRSDRSKLLYGDTDGCVIVYKRLEAGTFRFPTAAEGRAGVTLRAAELAMLLDGVDWQNAKRSKRYYRPATDRSMRRRWPPLFIVFMNLLRSVIHLNRYGYHGPHIKHAECPRKATR